MHIFQRLQTPRDKNRWLAGEDSKRAEIKRPLLLARRHAPSPNTPLRKTIMDNVNYQLELSNATPAIAGMPSGTMCTMSLTEDGVRFSGEASVNI